MEWLPIVSAVLSLIGYMLKIWEDGAPQRAQEATNAANQQGRTDIASGNDAAVSERIDSVLAVPATTGAGDPPGVGHDPAGESDASTLARMAALGCGGG